MAARTALWLAVALAAASADASMTPNAEVYLDQGLKHLYSLEYAQSRAAFRKLIELEPDNPFGYLFESGGIWWQSSQEYGLFKDTPTLQGLFEQDVEAAIRKAEPFTKSSDRRERLDGHFVMGMALGTRGQWDLMRGHYLKAYFDGRKALKHLKRCLKLDDEYYDVYLGLGVYDYQAAHLAGIARLGALVGVRGDEERGLDRLHMAMEKGRFASRQAAQFLSSIYILDKQDWARAAIVIERLRADFPGSVYFQALDAMVRWKQGLREESLSEGRALFERVKGDPAGLEPKLLSLVCGLYGDRCLNASHTAELNVWLTAAINAQGNDPAYQSLLRLYRANTYDILGRADLAAADYLWVLQHPDFGDNHARARECRKQACDAQSLLKYLRALSRGEPWPAPTTAADAR